jgi:hypothetical protein
MKRINLIVAVVLLSAGCGDVSMTSGDSISSEELEQFFRKHEVDGSPAVAMKKRSLAVSYLATIHGYVNNLSVCNELIAPYNDDSTKSTLPGEYYCEELR